jgi:hypothetical protein
MLIEVDLLPTAFKARIPYEWRCARHDTPDEQDGRAVADIVARRLDGLERLASTMTGTAVQLDPRPPSFRVGMSILTEVQIDRLRWAADELAGEPNARPVRLPVT